MRKYASTIILGVVLFFLSVVSLFVGVTDIDIGTLLRGGDAMELKIFFLARVPRLLAILCTGVGMSVAGLIMQQLSTYFVGSFALIIKENYELVWLALPLVCLAFAFANHFNIVGMGRDFSQNLGVNYKLVLFAGLTISAMITASVVTVVGQISYIGLIIPNIVAMFKGDKIQGTLIDTGLLGALFVLAADMIARVVILPYELPIELIVGIIGSILFIVMLIYKLNHGRKAVRLGKAKEGTCCG